MNINELNFGKQNGLIPVIIQQETTQQVLMLGYMNLEALEKTIKDKTVTFYSRSKGRLWTKGETSGNFLEVKSISKDCDQDALLIMVNPKGPTCHTGSQSCFNTDSDKGFIYELQKTVAERIESQKENSYTYSIFKQGINKIAQKVGEEAVEIVIEAMDNNLDLFKDEIADLYFHLLILLKYKNLNFEEIEKTLQERKY